MSANRYVIKINRPFLKEFTLRCEMDEIYQVSVKYERLGNFFFYCGRLEHEDNECIAKIEDLNKAKPVEEIQRECNLALSLRAKSPRSYNHG